MNKLTLTIVSGLFVAAVTAIPRADTPADTIIFSHATHVKDMEMECMSCHAAPAEKGGEQTVSHTSMETCSECHEDQVNEQCDMCHTNVDEAATPAMPHEYEDFSHEKHIDRGAKCSACHENAGEAKTIKQIEEPTMASCNVCHNDRKAPSNCAQCHADLASIKPQSHRAPGFLNRNHGRQARLNSRSCRECHQQSQCDKCHRGMLYTEVHDPNFTFTHGLEAKKREQRCTVCHEPRQFCLPCHEGTR